MVEVVEEHPCVLFGRHSNIPECCIEFWIEVWINLHWEQMKLRPQWENNRFNWNYIPCDDCYEKGHKVKVHYCTIECREEVLAIGMNVEWLDRRHEIHKDHGSGPDVR